MLFYSCYPRDENQKILPLRTKVYSCAWPFFRERMCEWIIFKYFLLIHWICLLNHFLQHFLLCCSQQSNAEHSKPQHGREEMVTGTTARYRRCGTNSQEIPRRPQNRFLNYHFDLLNSFCLSLWSTALPSQTTLVCATCAKCSRPGFFISANIFKLIHS